MCEHSQHVADFEKYYRLYRMVVYEQCRRRFASEEKAKDLESIVWTEVYRSFERFHIDDPRGILCQLVTWRARDLYRQQYKEAERMASVTVEDDHLLQMMERAQPKQLGPEEQMALSQVLQKESAEDRRLLFGRFVEGLSWEELATRHSLHRNTLIKRVKLSLGRLRERLSAPLPVEQQV